MDRVTLHKFIEPAFLTKGVPDPDKGKDGGFDGVIEGLRRSGYGRPVDRTGEDAEAGIGPIKNGGGLDDLTDRLNGSSDKRIAANQKFFDGIKGKSGADIVSEMEKNGFLVFKGTDEDKQKLKDALAWDLDHSQFFKTAFFDGFKQDSSLRITYEAGDTPGAGGLAGGEGYDKNITISADQMKGTDPNIIRWTMAHETFHGAGGLFDSLDMDAAMAAYRRESGNQPEGTLDARAVSADHDAGEQPDWELLKATREDYKSVGMLDEQDHNDYETPEMRDAMDEFFGPGGRERDPRQEFEKSIQSYDGDPQKIAEAYLAAKDGGEVEKIRAKQLQDLGIDPQVIKNSDNNINGLVAAYHDWFTADGGAHLKDRKAVHLTDAMKEQFADLVKYHQTVVDPGADLEESARWALDQVKGRLPGTFPDGELTADGQDNTIVDQHDNGAYANDILDGWFKPENGGEHEILDAYFGKYPPQMKPPSGA